MQIKRGKLDLDIYEPNFRRIKGVIKIEIANIG